VVYGNRPSYQMFFSINVNPCGIFRYCISSHPPEECPQDGVVLIEGWREATGWMVFHRTQIL